jgi:hypothetical protein
MAQCKGGFSVTAHQSTCMLELLLVVLRYIADRFLPDKVGVEAY